MSKDRWTYTLECTNCGTKDELHMWEDDWLRWGWSGMEHFSGRIYVNGPESEMLSCMKCGTDAPMIEKTIS